MAKKSELDNSLLVRLHNELKLAKRRNEHILLPTFRRNLARYTGEFVPSYAIDWDIMLNEIFPIVQYNIPSVFFRNPKAFIKPRNKTFIVKRRDPISGQMVPEQLDSMKSANTQEAILNYTVEKIGYKKETRKSTFDAHIAPFGVLWHGYKGEFGMTEEQSLQILNDQVFVKRISPLRFYWDPAVNLSNIDEARWIARGFDYPLEDLLEDDDLNVDKDQIKGRLGFGERVRTEEALQQMKIGAVDFVPTTEQYKSLIEFADEQFKNMKSARFVEVVEVFLRPSKKEKKAGEKGKVILLTAEQFTELRQNPWPYKAEGWPSKLLVFNDLPDSTYPLDDISTYEQIADNKNIIRNLQLRNAQENSKVWVALSKDGTNEEDIEKVKVGDQTIVLFEGDSVQGKMMVASPGAGASSELYLIDQRIDRELQDKSGVSDLKRGFMQSGEESATSVRARVAGSSVKPQFRQDIMKDFLTESMQYLNDLLRQFMPIKEAVRIVGSLDIQWSNKPTKEEIQADTDVEIDAISMVPENPEKEIQELNTILTLMTSALSNPAIFQKLQQEGYTFNLQPIIEQLLMRLKIKDPEVFRQIRGEESAGFASVSELRAARENVMAAMSGKQPPSPPQPGQDHRGRLEIYMGIQGLLQALGQQADILTQLIQQQAAIMQEEQERNAPKTPSRPKVNTQTTKVM